MYLRTILYVCKQYKCKCSTAICTHDKYVRPPNKNHMYVRTVCM